MTTEQKLANYQSEIEALAQFARSTGFDLENGDPLELMRNYIDATAPIYRSENAAEVAEIVKHYI